MHLFIADLHLSDKRPDLASAFFDFIDHQAKEAESLYILGDLFDLWLGEISRTPMSDQVAQVLLELKRHGTQVYLQQGNRDFLLASFAKQAGATLLPEYHRLDDLLICHGDSLCTDDIGYQKYKKIRDHRLTRLIWWLMPRFYQRKLAVNIQNKAKQASSEKQQDIMDVNLTHCQNMVRQHGCQRLLHGHTHRPHIHCAEQGLERTVLGDWGDKIWWAELEGKHLTLHQKINPYRQ